MIRFPVFNVLIDTQLFSIYTEFLSQQMNESVIFKGLGDLE